MYMNAQHDTIELSYVMSKALVFGAWPTSAAEANIQCLCYAGAATSLVLLRVEACS